MPSSKVILDNKEFILILTSGLGCISINEKLEKAIIENIRPIIWHNNGLNGLIKKERVSNDVRLRNEMRRAKMYLAPLVYYWSDVDVISEKVSPVRYVTEPSKNEDQTP